VVLRRNPGGSGGSLTRMCRKNSTNSQGRANGGRGRSASRQPMSEIFVRGLDRIGGFAGNPTSSLAAGYSREMRNSTLRWTRAPSDGAGLRGASGGWTQRRLYQLDVEPFRITRQPARRGPFEAPGSARRQREVQAFERMTLAKDESRLAERHDCHGGFHMTSGAGTSADSPATRVPRV